MSDRISEGYQQALARKESRIQQTLDILEEEIFFSPTLASKPILLEIGCGHGHWLNSYAELNPEMLCIGIDIVSKRIRKCLAKRDKRGLDNLFFYKVELNEFLDAFTKLGKSVNRFVFLFPDPWPKKRHFKHRMVQAELMTRLRSLSNEDTRFCFRSDHEGYFEWTIDILKEHEQWEVLDGLGEWPHESPTFFQSLMDSYQSVVAKPV